MDKFIVIVLCDFEIVIERFFCHTHDIAISFYFAKTVKINKHAMSRVMGESPYLYYSIQGYMLS